MLYCVETVNRYREIKQKFYIIIGSSSNKIMLQIKETFLQIL
jgi:hypothetical protein